MQLFLEQRGGRRRCRAAITRRSKTPRRSGGSSCSAPGTRTSSACGRGGGRSEARRLLGQLSRQFMVLRSSFDPLLCGTAVRQDVIDGSDQNWRFVDHHDGTGLAYFWPKAGAQGVPEFIELQVIAFPLRQLGKAGSFPPSRGNMPQAIPTRSGSVISTSTNRKSVPRPSGPWAAVDACGGGDCFFRSLAAKVPILGLSPNYHGIARCSTVQYMRKHPELFRDFVPLRDGQFYERCGARLWWWQHLAVQPAHLIPC